MRSSHMAPFLPPTRQRTKSKPLIIDSGNLFVDSGNLFNLFEEIDNVDDESYVPDYLNQDQVERRFQQRYELMLGRHA